MVKGTRAVRSGPAGAGLALAVLSAATFGTSGTFASALIRAGWSPAAAVIVRIAVSALILTVPALIQLRGRWGLLRRAAPRVTVYGLLAGYRSARRCCWNTSARYWWSAGPGCGTAKGRGG